MVLCILLLFEKNLYFGIVITREWYLAEALQINYTIVLYNIAYTFNNSTLFIKLTNFILRRKN